jgi:hypothetical protein
MADSECLVLIMEEMKANQEEIKAKIQTNQEKMEALKAQTKTQVDSLAPWMDSTMLSYL